MIKFKNTGPKISESAIQDFEKTIGFALPPSYRNFLLEFNGGQPIPEFFSVPDWSGSASLVNDLWGILPGKWNDLADNIELFSGRFPEGFFSIARDPGDNQILISLDGDTYGKIFFWDHENEPNYDAQYLEDYKNTYFLANDFKEFLNKLKQENEL